MKPTLWESDLGSTAGDPADTDDSSARERESLVMLPKEDNIEVIGKTQKESPRNYLLWKYFKKKPGTDSHINGRHA